MIEVKYIEGEFQVKGTFDWELAGVCENEEYRWSEEEGIAIKNELGVSVQFSDDWDCEYYCGAYEKFEPGFIPTDWHNF